MKRSNRFAPGARMRAALLGLAPLLGGCTDTLSSEAAQTVLDTLLNSVLTGLSTAVLNAVAAGALTFLVV